MKVDLTEEEYLHLSKLLHFSQHNLYEWRFKKHFGDSKGAFSQLHNKLAQAYLDSIEITDDYPPPWVAYPSVESPADMRWIDGYLLYTRWLHFVHDKPMDERQAYLERWKAPEDWIFLFTNDEFFHELCGDQLDDQ